MFNYQKHLCVQKKCSISFFIMLKNIKILNIKYTFCPVHKFEPHCAKIITMNTQSFSICPENLSRKGKNNKFYLFC